MSGKNKDDISQPTENKRRQRDIGWKHGTQIGDNRQHVQCNYCHKIMKGSGVSRLKHHLAGGNSNVERCDKCPSAVSKAMRDYLNRNKKENEKVEEQRAQMRSNLMGTARKRSGIEINDSDDSDDDDDGMTKEERDDLEYAKQQSIHDIHMAGEMYRRARGEPSTQKGGANAMHKLMRSCSVKEAWNKMSTKSQKDKKKGLGIHDMTPALHRNKEVQQAKLTHLWNPKKWAMSAKHAIAKFFIYENIPPSKAQGHFYQLMIDEIALADAGVVGPTSYEIGGPLLDDEIEELREYIELFKKKFDTYGVIIMCDGWSSTTRLAIINFLVYCDGKVIFHRSFNASNNDKDATFIYDLMDQTIQQIGDKHVVQIITDNGSAYKKAGEMLMEVNPHLYWTPCAAHSLDLILHDFAGIEVVQNVLDKAKRVTNFIYNHNRILAIYRTYCKGELIRPGQTRFGTNYISLQSILEHKSGLQRMFTSDDWGMSAGSKDAIGKRVQATILDAKFWEKAKIVVDIHAPIAKVLKMVNGERRATMPYVYDAMIRARHAIIEIAPKSCKKYLDIVDARWKKQIIQPIHMASYYLNPAYQYEEGVGVKESLLKALRAVVSRLEPDGNRASQALAEVKMFREAMYGFSDQAAIRGRTRTDPAEWWLLYGTDAPNLRRIAIRILSQTASSSGCERNWSTFALIHTKVRNRLHYDKLEKLVFAQYNMRLKVKHMFKEQRNQEFQPIDLSTIFDEDEENMGLSEWQDDPGDALLDEIDGNGNPNRPNTYVATWVNHPRDGGMAQDNSERGSKARGKQPMVSSDHDDDSDNGYGNNDDEDDDTSPPQGGSPSGNVGFSSPIGRGSQSPPGPIFTEEQGFTHATQDEDHGSRRVLQYERGQGRHCNPRNQRNNPAPIDAMDIDMIDTGMSSMSMSGGDFYGQGSSSSNAYGSGYDSHTAGQVYTSGYDSQVSSSQGYGHGHGLQFGCSQVDYERFRAQYEAWFRAYMGWTEYCRYIQNTYNVPLGEYPEPGPVYAPARHSSAGWM